MLSVLDAAAKITYKRGSHSKEVLTPIDVFWNESPGIIFSQSSSKYTTAIKANAVKIVFGVTLLIQDLKKAMKIW